MDIRIIYGMALASAILFTVSMIIGMFRKLRCSEPGSNIGIVSLVFAIGCAKIPLCCITIEAAEMYGIGCAIVLPLCVLLLIVFIGTLYKDAREIDTIR